ncbi:polyketide cyclase [Halobacteriales archaeon SW_7_68_16]|nr:MAG: polyketide cyclase [Halobacteriales archaeon SW_7_68_16]
MADTSVDLERTPDGRRLVVAARIDAPPDAVWTALIDTTAWPDWGPSVRAVDSPDRYVSLGTAGHIRTLGGLRVPFEITRFDADAPTRRWTWRVARLPATGHRVAPVDGAAACRAGFELPPLAAGYAPVCRRALTRLDRLATAGSWGREP